MEKHYKILALSFLRFFLPEFAALFGIDRLLPKLLAHFLKTDGPNSDPLGCRFISPDHFCQIFGERVEQRLQFSHRLAKRHNFDSPLTRSIEAHEFIAQQFFSRYTKTMLGSVSKFLLLLWSSSIYAMFIGNPAEPALLEKGIFLNTSWVSFRAGYSSDWVYKQRFQNEFLLNEETHTKNQLSTYAGMATLNFLKRLDLYSYLGSSKLQVDEQIFSRRAFSWCVGSKVMFLKHKNFFLGADVKYFETNQEPQYFVIEGLPFNVISDYTSRYFDMQAALGMSYRISVFVPYVNATYIYSHISPEPPIVAVRFPDINEAADVEIPTLICRKYWGMAIGFSLIDIAKASLAFEWRLFNQNGLNVNGEIRF